MRHPNFLCGGPILDGFDEEWAIEARDQHMHRLAAAFEAAAAGADDPADAVRLTRAGVALDPLAEAPNRRLIERLAANGDRAAALSASRQFVERLRAQLGIAPSRETRALIDDLRRGEPEPVPPPPGLTRPDETVFVGRRAELARLHASWGGVQMHRDRRIALIAGEPGIGKTRLAQQFASTCLAEGATVLLGRCSEEPLAPFEPFAEALTQAGVAQALAPGAATDDAGARHRLFDAVDSAITDLAATAPLLIVIDDLHWADRGSLLLTSFLLRSSRPGPILMLGTYRDTELARNTPLTRALAELKRTGALDRIDLRGLPLDDVATLARSMLGSDELAPRVHARTDGNAFFVEEVLRGWADSGAGEVPESVRHAVGLRLSSMGDAANELIAAGRDPRPAARGSCLSGPRRSSGGHRRVGARRDPARPAAAATSSARSASPSSDARWNSRTSTVRSGPSSATVSRVAATYGAASPSACLSSVSATRRLARADSSRTSGQKRAASRLRGCGLGFSAR